MINQRLFEIVQEADPPFITASAYSNAYTRWTRRNGSSILAEVEEIEQAIERVSEEFERIRRHGFLSSELERAKKQLLSRYERQWKEQDNREHWQYPGILQEHYLTGEPVPSTNWNGKLFSRSCQALLLTILKQLLRNALIIETIQ